MRYALPGALLVAFLSAAACGDSATVAQSSNAGDASTDAGPDISADSGTNATHDAGGTASKDAGSSVVLEGGTGKTAGVIKTVFIIMMENHSLATIQKSSSAAYINGTLANLGGQASAYSTPPGNHPSEPNYIWLEAGGNLGITTDDAPATNHQATTSHLVDQLETAGFTWKAYVEDIDGTTCPLTDPTNGTFVTRHTPMLFFDDVTSTNSATAARCIAHIRPYTELANDLNGATASYNFITPDLCHDMHGQPTGTTCFQETSDLVAEGDTWLKTNVPLITASAAFKNGGALFVIWDEGDEPLLQTASDGPLPFFVVSPFAKVKYSNTIAYTHSSTLRTVEEIFNLPLLGDAKNATNLSDFFTQYP